MKGDKTFVTVGDNIRGYRQLQGKFCDLRQAIKPAGEPVIKIGFNAKLLEEASQSVKDNGRFTIESWWLKWYDFFIDLRKVELTVPLVKQGKFREYYSRCESVKKMSEQCHNRYFDEYRNYDCMYDVFSEFFYSVDEVYCEAQEVKNGLESLIEFSEQKSQESVEKCKSHIKEMEDVINQCIYDFKRVYDSYNNDFSDAERDTFPNYKIYKEI